MTSRPVLRDASCPSCIASWVSWYCSVSVASITADFAPACASTSFVFMSTRSCSVATSFRCEAIVASSLSRSAFFCDRCASKEASSAPSWPSSAANTRSSRSLSAGPTPAPQSIGGGGEKARASTALSAASRRRLSARAAPSSTLAAATSACAAERSSSTRTSPGFTRLSLPTLSAATRPVSSGSTTLTRPVG